MKWMKMILPVLLVTVVATSAGAFVVNKAEYGRLSRKLPGMSAGDRMAFWAEQFVGNPYDPDPLGEYVSRSVIEADERVDCMYLTFRAAELALSNSYDQAVKNALNMRFLTKGRVSEDGEVMNYDERYQYAMDMIYGGKWGRNVTSEIGPVRQIPGSRGLEHVSIISRADAVESVDKIRNGDIIFFVKDPSKRIVGEIVGHIGIASVSGSGVFLIHASGVKKKGGVVKKVDLKEYVEEMPFIGIIVTRFD